MAQTRRPQAIAGARSCPGACKTLTAGSVCKQRPITGRLQHGRARAAHHPPVCCGAFPAAGAGVTVPVEVAAVSIWPAVTGSRVTSQSSRHVTEPARCRPSPARRAAASSSCVGGAATPVTATGSRGVRAAAAAGRGAGADGPLRTTGLLWGRHAWRRPPVTARFCRRPDGSQR